jgi:dTDP-4-dehydrorhamnose reductase
MKKILVMGKNGQLGKSIQNIIKNSEVTNNFVFVGREELELSDKNMINDYFKDNLFDIIINCAAYTNVDKAEEEPDLANIINNEAVSHLAQITKDQQAKLIHISTDYVFDGQNDKPYKETEQTNSINVYGKTKLAGEKAIQKILPTDATIIRASWIYSEYGNNFVKTMLKFGKEKKEIDIVSDQIGSPTYAQDLAEVILHIINSKNFKKKNQKTEIYHYSNQGNISWYEFAKEIFKIKNINCKLNPILLNNYPNIAKRPKVSLMDKSKIIRNFEIKILDFRKSLESCLVKLKE